ncbi:N-acyl homoserine lactonase family protein [Zeaxanthinibacter enoshimensis]|uniref:N-acyl homoserine lactonase family protein n=1 Tax=Zeaxanthinibacter enoshimensis TaxID=392009 RepID=UPI0035614511
METDKRSDLKVFVLDGGYMVINDLSMFTQDDSYDGQRKIIDNPVFLIEHKKGRLLWDTGLPDSLSGRIPGEVDTTTSILFYIRKKLLHQIRAMNLSPDSIEYLAVSHSHIDHAGNVDYFENSTLFIDERELGYATKDRSSTNNDQLIKNSEIITFTGSYDVFGDKSVIIHSMPGHTPGHMSLQVNLKRDTIFLTGDLYHFNEQRQFQRIPKFNTDTQQTLKSMEHFERLVHQYKAKVIIQHERTQFTQLPVYPEYLE